jgi:exodeoxyribonuclease-3
MAIRITTWNINGLRAALGKSLLDSLQSFKPDILCLQEIKTRQDQLDVDVLRSIQNHFPHTAWNPAQRPGYSGTATWANLEPVSVDIGLGFEEFDAEGRVIISRYADFWLFDFYSRLLGFCDQLHAQGQQLILCGDFNTAHKEIDIRHPRENSHSTGFLSEERAWIDKYLAHGFIDAFRRLYPDRVEYTWWTYLANARKNNVGWRLDYFLVSENLFNRVIDVINHTQIMGSDHCPVTLVLQ